MSMHRSFERIFVMSGVLRLDLRLFWGLFSWFTEIDNLESLERRGSESMRYSIQKLTKITKFWFGRIRKKNK